MATQIEIEFYSEVGLLSTKFAISEQLIQEILCLIISKSTNDTITLTMIEDMSLWKKLDLLKKILKVHSFWEKDLLSIIDRLDKVRVERNLFIHGLWKKPIQEGNKITVSVETKKIKFKEDKPDPELVKQGYSHSYSQRTWHFNSYKTYTLKQIKSIVFEINSIIIQQNKIIEDIKEKFEI